MQVGAFNISDKTQRAAIVALCVLGILPFAWAESTQLSAEETAYIAAGSHKIIPDPSMGRVTILTNEPGSTGEIKIVVYDMLGKIVASSNMNLTETGVPIDITGKARGIYYIRITDNQKTSMQKVIIQ